MDAAALLTRLEDAVKRLEKLGGQAGPANSTGSTPAPAVPSSAAPATVKPVPPAQPASAPAPAAAAAASTSATSALADFDRLLADKVAVLPKLSASLAAEIQTSVSHYVRAMEETRTLLDTAAKSPAPAPAALQQLLAPVAQHMMAAGKLVEGRRTAAFSHLKVLAEALQGLSWLAYTGPACGMAPPAQHVTDSWQSADFYANKLLMESRAPGAAPGSADAAVAWVKALKELSAGLSSFVGLHYPEGLRWNIAAGGGAASASAPTTGAPAPPPPPGAAGRKPGPPPPPPPGPPPKPLSATDLAAGSGAPKGAASGKTDMSALFKELQKGEAITGTLKKVTDDMKTKHNPNRTGVVSIAEKSAAPAPAPAAGAKAAPPPRLEYDTNLKKWIVENQVGKRDLVLDQVSPQQGIYIFGCKDCVIKVTSKANAISVDSCVKTGVMFTDLICACEVVNSRSLQLQCTGYVPTVSIEKTDGVQLYVSKEVSRNADFQVVTAKCSEVNVHVIAPEAANGEWEDPVEHAVPEQFISSFDKAGQLITKAAAHSGA